MCAHEGERFSRAAAAAAARHSGADRANHEPSHKEHDALVQRPQQPRAKIEAQPGPHSEPEPREKQSEPEPQKPMTTMHYLNPHHLTTSFYQKSLALHPF